MIYKERHKQFNIGKRQNIGEILNIINKQRNTN